VIQELAPPDRLAPLARQDLQEPDPLAPLAYPVCKVPRGQSALRAPRVTPGRSETPDQLDRREALQGPLVRPETPDQPEIQGTRGLPESGQRAPLETLATSETPAPSVLPGTLALPERGSPETPDPRVTLARLAQGLRVPSELPAQPEISETRVLRELQALLGRRVLSGQQAPLEQQETRERQATQVLPATRVQPVPRVQPDCKETRVPLVPQGTRA